MIMSNVTIRQHSLLKTYTKLVYVNKSFKYINVLQTVGNLILFTEKFITDTCVFNIATT